MLSIDLPACSRRIRNALMAAAAIAWTVACAQAQVSPLSAFPTASSAAPTPAPVPLLRAGKPTDWWFTFKFNAKAFPGCGGGADETRACPFGGEAQKYTFGQQYVYASSGSEALQKGGGCVGASSDDPVGATFDQIYNGSFYYVVWNDQFYDDPEITGCSQSCPGPWGHSKGILAWNEVGEGLVMQVTTPSWPAAGGKGFPRRSDGNTLGCVKDDDVKVSQHFFALKLNRDDLIAVLQGLQNASVVTDPKNLQLVRNGGPAAVQTLVSGLGRRSGSTVIMRVLLSSGVGFISKPSGAHVPPWQMVSSLLGGVAMRAATWWASPEIPTTVGGSVVGCWRADLAPPGPVDIAITGNWEGTGFGLKGGPGPDFNHAKLGVTTNGSYKLAVFGDMNQQGSLSGPNCASSQNGRGGLFYVVDSATLTDGIASLIAGESAAPQ